MKTRLLPFLVLTSFAFCAGCRLFKPTEDHIRYYTLGSQPVQSTVDAPASGAPVVGLAPIILPGYLARSAVAVRLGPNEISYRTYDAWADRLDRSIQREISADLRARLGVGAVRSTNWRREDVRCELYLSVLRFDFDEAGKVTLEAGWRLTEPGEGKDLVTRISRFEKSGPSPGQDMPGAINMLREALAELSGEIAKAIQGIGR
jgi:uncharacterized lipoprotein YmbA